MDEAGFLRATRESYDAVAEVYGEIARDELGERPLARGMLMAFAEFVRGPVVEMGAGPGQVAAYLHGLGVDVRGIDLSPAMVALARREHPGVRYDVGSMTELGVEDGSLGGLVAWYSLIHIPPELRPEVLAGFHRALAPGGHLLLAFQVGDGHVHFDAAFGEAVDLDFHRMDPERLEGQLEEAGFEVRASLVRRPEPTTWGPHEKTPHAHMIARKAPLPGEVPPVPSAP
ncbi:class I SAM-dependent methyltransferase [Streptomyces sp. DSM 44917]|uniref:Class I SAM-dependent methyltransferase n=1 Tax=Streptomyces boetiae TaxID=3075541 RepID=A0ABU2LEK9_9ACTN|nr:class I SAM-dependent methyltransferase [Streptomyces sp. DSM 44917]MDT0310037.1 class I SAM-dependent methyltransferase [Streptomyces sp. DSM 44917]